MLQVQDIHAKLPVPFQQSWHCIETPTDDQELSTHGQLGPGIPRQSDNDHQELTELGSTRLQSYPCLLALA